VESYLCVGWCKCTVKICNCSYRYGCWQ